jgi:hypothetical protein
MRRHAKSAAAYKRGGNSTARNSFGQRGPSPAGPAFFDEGNSATLKFDLALPAAGDEPLAEAIDALAALSSWLHAFSQEPTLKEVPVVVPQEPALPGQPAPPPSASPMEAVRPELRQRRPYDSLNGAPLQGLRLREIKSEYQAGHLMWSVSGDLYAK